MKLPLSFLLPIISLSVSAQIITDGTLGPALNIQGPNYQIGPDLGQQRGGNLFHSFQDFNLNSLESATFSGPNHIQAVISRVTGGNPSNIDGLFRSTIPGADVYFLNPYGIMFGPNAQLDVQGSFHASTADYLRLGENGRFDARNPSDSLLTIAPIEAFGFLTDNPSLIATQNSDLSVPENQTLSLIGGDLDLRGHSSVLFDEQGFMAIFARSKLSAPAGRVNLVSAVSKGEVIPSTFGLDLNAKGGQMTANNTLVDVSGRGGGSIFIRGGQFIMEDAVIQANTLADQDGKIIDIALTEAFKITGNLLAISSNTFNIGNAGHISITTPLFKISESVIYATTIGKGHAGNITLQADTINILDGTIIASDSYGSGSGGQLNITATDKLFISDQRLFLNKEDAKFSTGISSGSFSNGNGGHLTVNAKQLSLVGGVIISNTHKTGNAGQIVINAEQLQIKQGGLISATTFSQASGTGGDIEITTDTLHLSGFRPGFIRSTTDFFKNTQSGIAAITFGDGLAGNISILAKNISIENYASIGAATGGNGIAGQMIIEVDNLSLKSGGLITTSSGGIIGGQTYLATGASGTLVVIASGDIFISGRSDVASSGLFSNTLVSGEGGNIEIQANHLTLTDGATISANSLGTGKAGNFTVQANTINLTDNATITTSAAHASGGNMTIITPNALLLNEGQITTSVHGGKGDGGNITIDNPVFVVLNQGQIKAQANEGFGGNIRIVAEQFIASPDSLVSASSRLGLDGQVKIDSPTVDLSGALLVLATNFEATTELKPPCSLERVAQAEQNYSLVVKSMTGAPPSPGDWKANRLVLLPVSAEKSNSAKISLPQTDTMRGSSVPSLKVASLFGCQQTENVVSPKNNLIPDPLF